MRIGLRKVNTRASLSVYVAVCGVLMAACTPFSTKMNSWIGTSIDRYMAVPGRDRELVEVRGPDSEGNKTYSFRIERKCSYEWLVDPSGKLKLWTSQGPACKGYWF
jgi:hypothetical protein